jgi:hypothetical protein
MGELGEGGIGGEERVYMLSMNRQGRERLECKWDREPGMRKF